MVHENYMTVITSQNTNVAEKMRNCHACIDALINADIIEKVMYNTQSWYLQPLHGLCSCYVPNYYANVVPKLAYRSASWTTTLGNYSLKRSNLKDLKSLSFSINNGHIYPIEQIQLMRQVILYHLLDPHGSIETGIQYMRTYNLNINSIDKLIKIDKLSDKYKKLYTTRKKTQLTELLKDLKPIETHSMTYHITKKMGREPIFKTEKVKKGTGASTSASVDADADDTDADDTDAEAETDNETESISSVSLDDAM